MLGWMLFRELDLDRAAEQAEYWISRQENWVQTDHH